MEAAVELPAGLDVVYEKGFLTKDEEEALLNYLKSDELLWNRPSYFSNRFQKHVGTPCWCSVQGGLEGMDYYQPIAPIIAQIKKRIEARLNTEFNVCLLRLYFGNDEIAYHTDAREFLGSPCSVASISLGATRRFDMKRVEGPLWPEIRSAQDDEKTMKRSEQSEPKKARKSEIVSWHLSQGDLFVMQGETQNHFYHAVPKEAAKKNIARFNLNFRRIIVNSANNEAAARGHATYYKYCVHGDNPNDWKDKAKTYKQLAPLTLENFFKPSKTK